jgi:hypothetical protein
VDLRGTPKTGPAPLPVDVLRCFLLDLGVPVSQLPSDLDLAANAAFYRSRLAGRRVLVLLDAARDAEQARALLPGSPGCLVMVTSRSRLPGLVARTAAQPMAVGSLSNAEARDMLAHRLGRDRVDAAPDAVDEIIARCLRSPGALAAAAATAATRPGRPLDGLAFELGQRRNRAGPHRGPSPQLGLPAVRATRPAFRPVGCAG